MPIIQLENVWKAYGANPVLTGVSWRIEPGDRVGLVGRNGCGKTTLFHLLTGRLLPDAGQIHRQRRLNIGYLAQDAVFEGNPTVIRAVMQGFQDLLDLRSRLTDLEARMASGESRDALLADYGRLRDRYEHGGGYALEARAQAILHGLGFLKKDFGLQAAILSGGQKNRLALAQLLACSPDLLLLDEPTNHLDLQALEWLESFLSDSNATFVVISHDRYFLDRTVKQILELEGGRLERYSGNYSFYAREGALRQRQRQKAYEAQQAYISQTEEYIRRNIAGQKTKQAQSRRKALAKLERVDRPAGERDIKIRFSAAARGSDRVLQIERLSKSYNGRHLFRDLDLILWRGDRLGIVGPNGSGKSTLLRLLVSQVAPDNGRISLGRGVRIGYYDQSRQDLHPDATVLDEVWSLTPDVPMEEIRTFLGAFLFSGDDVDRKIGNLSGGEQSRVAIAKLIRSGVNLLVLDEPTNHLDIASRIVLEDALAGFDGTLLAASHDRYFLNRLFNRLLLIEDGGWRLIAGNYTALREQMAASSAPPVQEAVDKAARKASYEETRKTQREQERRKRRAGELEEQISRLEAEIERLDGEMSREDLAADWARLQEMSRQRAGLQRQIEACFAEWESIEAQFSPARTE